MSSLKMSKKEMFGSFRKTRRPNQLKLRGLRRIEKSKVRISVEEGACSAGTDNKNN